ncbi:hypothetical protein [Acetobacter conturbans]|uniref:HNH endonuclease n=1 Tax=Acetobacter conturbans TaxID=1737472 RepID=A0ABX0K713_9PROT|nr:hypothetical protein [Acetobacter conturbans]NHN89990.1 hypothetical protein [Acetobacter conturbans]
MVTHLRQPEACSIALIDAIVAERASGRNATFFNGLAAEWRQRIEYYIAEHGNPETVPTWSKATDRRTPFLTLYNTPRENSSQLSMLTQLRDRTLRFCPSCGEEGTPNTLDHYLPKEQFPHFAITPLNLTPMCDICQGAKGTKTTDESGRRMFLHPYYDDFLASQVVHLTIGHPFSAPKEFFLKPSPDLPNELFELVDRHIKGLEMECRYGKFFRDEYIRLLRLSQEARDAGDDVRKDIQKFKRMHEMRAVNLWPHIFYAAVVKNQELLDYLANGDLPAML